MHMPTCAGVVRILHITSTASAGPHGMFLLVLCIHEQEYMYTAYGVDYMTKLKESSVHTWDMCMCSIYDDRSPTVLQGTHVHMQVYT